MKATHTVHCPNGPVHACEKHAATIVGLLRFLGTHAAVTAAPPDAECSNCANEAKLDVRVETHFPPETPA